MDGEGWNVGLSISHNIIVKQHGGSIEVDTQPGDFTEFRIVLPRGGLRRCLTNWQTDFKKFVPPACWYCLHGGQSREVEMCEMTGSYLCGH